ncbi:MAG: DUF1992 domain-containing protein [Caldimicrobium sp.]|nr:DUF1992 domain-containing protein [Caldimicrobium sp.]MDW8183578.1 DUF1992 domain-containing protein [Caldimicrobium sp.]
MPFSIFKKIAEERISEAIERGDFDDLELKGKPLDLKEDPFVPEELRIAYRMLKNAGFLPKEVELKKEIEKLEEALDEDHQEALGKIKKLSVLLLHLGQMRSKPLYVEDEEYYAKIVEKIRTYKRKVNAITNEKRERERIDFSRLQVMLSIKSLALRKR